MSVEKFTNELKLVMAHAAEFEHDKFVLCICVGSRQECGDVNYMIAIAHRPDKMLNVKENVEAIKEINLFVHGFDELPTTVIVCHVDNIQRDVVATYLTDEFQKAAWLPVPADVGDVEFLTIQSWIES